MILLFAKIYTIFIIHMYRTSIKSGHRGHSLILLQIKDDVVSICLCFQTSQTAFCRQKCRSRATQQNADRGYMGGGVLTIFFFYSTG